MPDWQPRPTSAGLLRAPQGPGSGALTRFGGVSRAPSTRNGPKGCLAIANTNMMLELRHDGR
jgi:hypothetical protein